MTDFITADQAFAKIEKENLEREKILQEKMKVAHDETMKVVQETRKQIQDDEKLLIEILEDFKNQNRKHCEYIYNLKVKAVNELLEHQEMMQEKGIEMLKETIEKYKQNEQKSFDEIERLVFNKLGLSIKLEC